MTEVPVMRLSDFSKAFEVMFDASGISIDRVLSQEKHSIAFLSEKLSGTKLNYSTYDKEFYAVVQSLCHWRHYLLPQEFVLYSDHETLRYLNSQKKLSARHGRWIEFMQNYTYTLKHTSEGENKVANALSHRICLFKQLNAEEVNFEWIKEEYVSCPDFEEIFGALKQGVTQEMVSYSKMIIYFDFAHYAFLVHHYETILFENCMLRVLLVTSDEKKP